MYTDGIIKLEAMNCAEGRIQRRPRLCELLWEKSALPCASIIQTIQDGRAHAHQPWRAPFADDQTLVLLKKIVNGPFSDK